MRGVRILHSGFHGLAAIPCQLVEVVGILYVIYAEQHCWRVKMNQEVVDCLIAARKRIENPANWGKDMDVFEEGSGKTCMLFALTILNHDVFQKSVKCIQTVTNCDSIAIWNDAPERTHAEVLEAFDRAIELVQCAI